MIARFVRRAMLTALCLLTLAPSASAECAWVLWDIDAPTQAHARPTVYTADSAYRTKEACEPVAREKANRPWNNQPQQAFVRFVCLPDTVDPRGPKGKP